MVLHVIAEEAISLLLGAATSLLKEKVDLVLGAEEDLKELQSKLKYFQEANKVADRTYSFLSDDRDTNLERTLKDVFYDAEDIIEEHRTKIELTKKEENSGFIKREEDSASRNKVRNLWISPCSCFKKKVSFPYTLAKEIKEINERLEAIKRDYKEMLNMLKRSAPNASGDHQDRLVSNNPRETTHLIGPQPPIGREDDKENLKKLLLDGYSTESGVSIVSIVSIVGQGGIGKTTLAKTVFNEVKEQFGDRRWWVCVSNKPNPVVLLQKILEVCKRSKKERDPEIGRSEGQREDYTSLGLSECSTKLKKELSNGKFLLVLDDVWELDWWWKNVEDTLTGSAMGSKILITSRRTEVSDGIGAKMHKLRVMTFDESWKLFLEKALKQEKELASHNLEDIAKNIVNKCGGLPLAVQTMGSLMRTKAMTKDEWEMVEKSEIWEWSMPASSSSSRYGDILPALILSYDDLPNYYMKRCFVYCCIYPKNYEMKREELVMQWVAHGFVEEKNKRVAVEAIANGYINDLISRCLIEETEAGDVKLHDILHDLASYIGGEEYSDASTTQHTRHLSLLNIENHANSGLGAANKLRTFFGNSNLILSSSNIAQLAKFKQLRVLSLRNSEIKFELPDSIQDLLLLKYLDLSKTEVSHLPRSIGRLYNLQTLNLNGSAIEELPKEIGDLCSLKYLGLQNTWKLKFMAGGLGRLTNLRTLHRFLVCNNKGKTVGCNIRELKGLKKLKGSLSIEGLTGAMVIDAKEAHLKEKYELTDVKLYFKSSYSASKHSELLEALEPPHGIEIIEIRDYLGEMPAWYSKANYAKLQELRLFFCPSWATVIGVNSLENVEVDVLPLKSLRIVNSDRLKTLAYMSTLETLGVYGCDNLEQVAHMPTLERLKVHKCCNLEQVAHMPALERLEVWECDKLEQVADDMPALKRLRLTGRTALKQLPASLPSLEELEVLGLEEWEGWPTTMTSHSMSSLTSATFQNCPKMETEGLISAVSKVGGDDSHIQLQCLMVLDCPRARLGWKLLMHLLNLIRLELDSNSAEITSPFQPSEASNFLPSLKVLYLLDNGRDHLKWGRVPEWVWLLSRLEVLRLSGFSEEISLGGRWQCLPKLTTLTLRRFPNLKSLLEINDIIAQQHDGAAASTTTTSVTIAKQQIDCLSKLEQLYIDNCPALHLPQELKDRLGKRFLTF